MGAGTLALSGIRVVVFAITLIALRVYMRFWSMDTVGSDTYYAWVEGRRIREGRNPYERILHGGMEENNKYATYFPLFYEDSALVQEVGLRQYQPWIDFWRYIFLACNLLVGVTLAVLLFPGGHGRWRCSRYLSGISTAGR